MNFQVELVLKRNGPKHISLTDVGISADTSLVVFTDLKEKL